VLDWSEPLRHGCLVQGGLPARCVARQPAYAAAALSPEPKFQLQPRSR
jgi:hypothetical protein